MKWFVSIGLYIVACSSLAQLPKDFVNISEINSNILIELRYYSTSNFIGDTIDGYRSNRAIMTRVAAMALSNVQNKLETQGLGLKVFDAYRPQQAVDHFVRWSRLEDDTLMKAHYYPNIPKNQLFKRGYIASKSGHSRGSTVDLTLVELDTGKELDMGSPWDFFGEVSHHTDSSITSEQRKNRELLKNHMLEAGFRSYKYEWWHYTLNNEPYKNRYFDF